jgi:hypothetical protein
VPGAHREGDEAIFAKIRDLCPLEFPILREVFGTQLPHIDAVFFALWSFATLEP